MSKPLVAQVYGTIVASALAAVLCFGHDYHALQLECAGSCIAMCLRRFKPTGAVG